MASLGAAVALTALAASAVLDHPKGLWPRRPAETAETVLDLGITYLPVSRGLSSYYNLQTDSGALVTSVTPGSAAERMGIKPGDVIVAFNGSSIQDGVSLLSLIRACQSGTTVEMEVSRGQAVQTVRFVH